MRNLLRNLADDHDPVAAAEEQRAFSLLRRRELEVRPVNEQFDLRYLKEIHRRLYRDHGSSSK